MYFKIMIIKGDHYFIMVYLFTFQHAVLEHMSSVQAGSLRSKLYIKALEHRYAQKSDKQSHWEQKTLDIINVAKAKLHVSFTSNFNDLNIQH